MFGMSSFRKMSHECERSYLCGHGNAQDRRRRGRADAVKAECRPRTRRHRAWVPRGPRAERTPDSAQCTPTKTHYAADPQPTQDRHVGTHGKRM